jgi:pyruvate dehydrogenase E1 component beta subunit
MVLACNSLVNQIAKWSHMLGGQSHPSVTVRAIINRGGEQGAQHSQSLHSWFAHIPGLRVVMPATAKDARDLLVASVLCDDPVLYIDDRWCYEEEDELGPIEKIPLSQVKPQLLRTGTDLTLVASGYSSVLAKQVADLLLPQGITCDVLDLRVVNPIDFAPIMNSVEKTNRLAVIDGSWKNCGLGGEVIASVVEKLPCNLLKSRPARFGLPAAPAPTSKPLEKDYYPTATGISQQILENFF